MDQEMTVDQARAELLAKRVGELATDFATREANLTVEILQLRQTVGERDEEIAALKAQIQTDASPAKPTLDVVPGLIVPGQT